MSSVVEPIIIIKNIIKTFINYSIVLTWKFLLLITDWASRDRVVKATEFGFYVTTRNV